MPPSTIASASGSRATLATKLVPRSSIRFLFAQFVSHFGRRLQRRAHDRRVARAAAKMPAEEIANRRLVRPRMITQKTIQRHQNAGRAEAALQRMIALERRLQNAEAARRRREAFHGPDIATVDLHGERQAGARRRAVDADGAGAANAVLAADMGAGHSELMPQEIGQQQPRLDLAGAWLAVQ